jgi:hypothetical protein
MEGLHGWDWKRPISGAPTCESAHSIDLAVLRRRGLLSQGHCSSLTWSRGGQRTDSIDVIAEANGIRLRYVVTDRHGERIAVNELVPFAYSAAGAAARFTAGGISAAGNAMA